MPVYHPIFVHFPIALLSFAFVVEALSYFMLRPDWSRTGWWSQAAGTLMMFASVFTGLLAEQQVSLSESIHIHLDNHKELAFVAVALFATLLLWRIATRTKVPPEYPRLFLLLFGLGVIMLWWAAWYGGELVFRYGVGVTP